MIRAYFRCNGGDYFCDQESCPFDGWSSPDLKNFNAASKVLKERNEAPSISAFRRMGLSDAALKRVIVIEFGNDQSAFEAMSPGVYLKDGAERTVGNLSPDLT